MFRFVRLMAAFRRRHGVLRRKLFFAGGSDISWHGERQGQPDWSEDVRWLAFLLDGGHASDDHLFVMMNASEDWRHFEVPHRGREWRRVVDTSKDAPEDVYEDESRAPSVGYQSPRYAVEPRSLVVLVMPR